MEEWWGRAEYEFPKGEAGDLGLEVGDVVRVTGSVDGAWLRGRRLEADQESPEGVFPRDFVSQLGLPSVGSGETVLVALCDFPAQASGDLGLERGRLVVGRKRVDENWWEGLLVDSAGRATAQHGIFPANFVRALPSASPAAASPITARLTQTIVPQLDDEMGAQKGELVRVTRQIDKMWVEAESLDGKRRGNIPRGFLAIELECGGPEEPLGWEASEPATPTAQSLNDDEASAPPAFPPPPPPPDQLSISTAAETQPYAITKHAFRAVDGSELSFETGEIVLLLGHPDDEWSEGELAGKRGLFPTAFVDIVVDVQSPTQASSPAQPQSQPPPQSLARGDAFGDSGYTSANECAGQEQRTVLYDFAGSEQGDLSCRAGDVVRILRLINADWVEAAHTVSREVGLVPAAFLDEPSPAPVPPASPAQAFRRPKSSPSLDAVFCGKGDDSGHSSSHSNTPSLVSATSRASGDLFFTPPSSPTPSPSLSLAGKPPRPKASPALSQLPVQSPAQSPEERARTAAATAEALQAKQREQRSKVAEELVASEDAFSKDVQRTISALDAAARVGSAPVNPRALLSGFPQVAALSVQLHEALRAELAKGAERGSFGKVFLDKMDSFRKVYEWFWEASEESVELLREYEADPAKLAVLKDWLERMRTSGTVCLDPTAALTRPLQRVLKYPLFISQLLKASPPEHPDRKTLSEALEAMTSLAQAINEAKRRKDLVLKYRGEERSLGTRLSHISIHSFLKKSSRLAGRLKQGFVEQERDEAYEAAERDYRNVAKAVRHFLKDLTIYTDQLQHASMHHASLLQSWREVAGGQGSNLPDSFKLYQDATRRVVQVLLPAYFDGLRTRVREPLNALAAAFPGPDKLIAKRKDKLLDYRAAMGKAEQRRSEGPESRQSQLASEQESRARAEYEALHSQLLAELPRLAASAQDILRTALHSLAAQQRSFQQQLRHAYASLDGYAEPLASLLSKFDAKHRQALETLAAASNAPRSRPPPPSEAPAPVPLRRKSSQKKETSASSIRNSIRFKPLMKTSGSGKVAFPARSQSEADRNSLRAKAVAGGLYVVRQAYTPAPDAAMDLAVSPGDLVIPLIRKDPMGTTQRWYVDSGIGKGFIPSVILALVHSHKGPEQRPPLPALPKGPEKPAPPQRSLSMVASPTQRPASLISFDDEPSDRASVASSHLLDLQGLDLSAPPPVPPQHQPSKPLPQPPSLPSPSPSDPPPINWGPVPTPQAVPKRSAPGPPVTPSSLSQLSAKARPEASCSPAVPSASRPPLYSNVGFDSPRTPVRAAPPPPLTGGREEAEGPVEKEEPVEFFVAEWAYEGGEDGELALAQAQVVAVHKRSDQDGNPEWWLVEDEFGAIGYVPSNYLAPHK